MKEAVNGVDDSEVIVKYYMVDNNILVKYLDGKVKILSNDLSNKIMLDTKMDIQSQQFISTYDEDKESSKEEIHFYSTAVKVFQVGTILVDLFGVMSASLPFVLITSTIGTHFAIKNNKNICLIEDYMKELEKHKLYHENKEIISKYSNINLNNIDDLSIDDFKLSLYNATKKLKLSLYRNSKSKK